MGNRDIIVIGASMGGIEALSQLVRQLPRDLPAAVFVVQHVGEDAPGVLPEILMRYGPLPATLATDGADLRHGRILVAPPGRHLLLTRNGTRVVFGPRENRCRPAIDPLFRTAAANFDSRVIGVVLTGLPSDGGAGLWAVKRCGGVALAQAPDDAAYPDMPRRALAAVEGAESVPLDELGPLLGRLTAEEAPPSPPVAEVLKIEVALTERAMRNHDWERVPGRSTDFTCPECSGAIRVIEKEGIVRYRCRVGHAYTLDALVAAKDAAVEDALWLAMQTLQERAQMLETLARDARQRGWERSAADFQERAREAWASAGTLRNLVAQLSGSEAA